LQTIPKADVAVLVTKYPDTIEFGGNTGTANSVTGLTQVTSLAEYTTRTLYSKGPTLDASSSKQQQQGIPEALPGLLSDPSPVISLLNKWIDPAPTPLDCPALKTFNQRAFDQFPGPSYHPTS